jgi:hypothetical protein
MKVIIVKIGYQEFVAPAAILDLITQLQPIDNFWDKDYNNYRTYISDSKVSVSIVEGSNILPYKPEPKTNPAPEPQPEPTPE